MYLFYVFTSFCNQKFYIGYTVSGAGTRATTKPRAIKRRAMKRRQKTVKADGLG